VVSLLDPDHTFPDLGPEYRGQHLRLRFHDAHDSSGGEVAPNAEHIDELISFLSGAEPAATILIHCRAGIGRSTAGAYVTACLRSPGSSEQRIAEALRRIAPLARPNETVVRLADDAMGRDGRMSAAISVTGRDLPWIEIDEGVPFELPSALEG